MSRMKAAALEHAQSRMRLENQTQGKGEVAAEHSVPTPVTSDLLNLKEAAAYLRFSVTQSYNLTRRRGVARAQYPIPVVRMGIRTLRFRKSSLDKWLAELEKMAG
jgi:predicted DNA-binding transcriptional regulator AlpA